MTHAPIEILFLLAASACVIVFVTTLAILIWLCLPEGERVTVCLSALLIGLICSSLVWFGITPSRRWSAAVLFGTVPIVTFGMALFAALVHLFVVKFREHVHDRRKRLIHPSDDGIHHLSPPSV